MDSLVTKSGYEERKASQEVAIDHLLAEEVACPIVERVSRHSGRIRSRRPLPVTRTLSRSGWVRSGIRMATSSETLRPAA